MKNKHLFALWGFLYILCAAVGFLPTAGGAARILRILLAAAFFLPPLVLIHRGGQPVLLLIRNLAVLWLILTTALIIGNFLTVGAPVKLGNMLFVLLAIVSSPMICGEIWVLSLFGWAFLLFAAVGKIRKP